MGRGTTTTNYHWHDTPPQCPFKSASSVNGDSPSLNKNKEKTTVRSPATYVFSGHEAPAPHVILTFPPPPRTLPTSSRQRLRNSKEGSCQAMNVLPIEQTEKKQYLGWRHKTAAQSTNTYSQATPKQEGLTYIGVGTWHSLSWCFRGAMKTSRLPVCPLRSLSPLFPTNV